MKMAITHGCSMSFETPVWKHWVKILTNFEYEDYPLWLIK